MKKKQIQDFQDMIFTWWQTHARDLPWRHTHDPYRILISEMMLQQTQVSRVIPAYKQFLEKFPDIKALAQASTADVLISWKGMGYNRRALYLKQIATIIVQKYKNVFPQQEKLLLELPGLGIYTVRALLVFAFNQDVSVVDTNIRKIITHFFFADIPQSSKIISDVADILVPKGKSWEWHQALMDYGALALRIHRDKQQGTKKEKIPFHQTDRYFRGRLMDMLRIQDMKKDMLQDEFTHTYDVSELFFQKILDQLKKDGLVSQSGNTIHLPA